MHSTTGFYFLLAVREFKFPRHFEFRIFATFPSKYLSICGCQSFEVTCGFNAKLSSLNLKEINFREIKFRRCKICHISRGFIFAEGETLTISRGFIFAVSNYVIFMSSKIIVGKITN